MPSCDLRPYLVYYSVKYVRILHWPLGLLRITCGCAMIPVLLLPILRGSHLKSQEIVGHFRAQLQRPTRGNCDPWKLDCHNDFSKEEDLRYCLVNDSDTNWYTKPDGIQQEKLNCTYIDEMTLVQPDWQGYFIPLRIKEYNLRRNDETSQYFDEYRDTMNEIIEPDAPTGPSGKPMPNSEVYVADLERFTLKLWHSASVPAETWQDKDMDGYFRDSSGTEHRIPQNNESEIQKSTASGVDENGTVIRKRGGHGDVLLLDTLLQDMIGIDLDETYCDCGGSAKRAKETLRRCGTRIELVINYTNMARGGYMGLQATPYSSPKPYYTISGTRIRDCMSRWSVFDSSGWLTKPKGYRAVAEFKGILLSISSSGTYTQFEPTKAFLYIMASSSVISIALLALDYVLEMFTRWFELVKYDTKDKDQFEEDQKKFQQGISEVSEEPAGC